MNYKWLQSTFSPGGFKTLSKETHQKERDETTSSECSHQESEPSNSESVFTCPNHGCVRVFLRLGNLERHLAADKCTRVLEKHTLLDLAKMGYKTALEEGVGIIPTLKASNGGVADRNANPLSEGWALRSTKKAYRFSPKQKEYLLAKFEIGQTTGRKVDANSVAQDMRRVRDSDGTSLFQLSEFLKPQQIASYFSRVAAQRRKQTSNQTDVNAIQEETNYSAARNEIMTSLGLEHPIVYGQHNICDLVASNTLKNLKLGMLKVICESLGLNTPEKPQ